MNGCSACRKSQSLPDLARDEALRRFAGAFVARLATINPSGEPDLVPITFALTGHRLVTAVDHKPKTTPSLQRLANVARHPLVTVLADHYDDDWSALWWVRLRGPAVVVEPTDPSHAVAIAPLVGKYAAYGDRAPAGAALIVDVAEVRGWAAVAVQ